MADTNADHGNDQERMFTQSEVNELISKRLERERAKHEAKQPDEETLQKVADLENKATELNKKEFELDCKSYLMEKGYNSEIINFIDADDLDTFKEKADKLNSMIGENNRRTAPPLGSTEDNMHVLHDVKADKIADAFSIRSKHEPKDIY